MALVQLETGDDPWLAEEESCERLHRELTQELAQRNAYRAQSSEYSRLSANIRIKLKQYSTEVSQLRTSLLYSSSITQEEKERRQRLVEDLESKQVQLSQQLRTSREAMERSALLGSDESRSWLEDAPSRPQSTLNEDYVPSVSVLRQQQTEILEEQNRGLENLSKVISRQKNIALTIGSEVDLHNDLLDDISTRMDSTNTTVQQESAHVRVILEKDSTFCYWLAIIILFLIIIFLALF